jgi:hypothetical protein
MKPILISLLALTSCASIDAVQVNRVALTVNRIETKYRYPNYSYQVIWTDWRGNEYTENVQDTTAYRVGMSMVHLLKR